MARGESDRLDQEVETGRRSAPSVNGEKSWTRAQAAGARTPRARLDDLPAIYVLSPASSACFGNMSMRTPVPPGRVCKTARASGLHGSATTSGCSATPTPLMVLLDALQLPCCQQDGTHSYPRSQAELLESLEIGRGDVCCKI